MLTKKKIYLINFISYSYPSGSHSVPINSEIKYPRYLISSNLKQGQK